ncbi:MAG: cobaltochelatase subunit CobT [Betaproteobacteria bacterium]|nr:cobaltochelatase subunit CobT [Betaproteobacteria bacterium]
MSAFGNLLAPRRSSDATETFLRAVDSTLRAMAGRAGEATAAVREAPARSGPSTSPPCLALTAEDRVRLRGQADAQALRLRYHHERLHTSPGAQGTAALAAYEAIEQARVEALGLSLLPGANANIDAWIAQHCRDRKFDRAKDQSQVPLAEALRVFARERFCDAAPPPAALAMLEVWRPYLDAQVAPQLDGLRQHLHDERTFAQGLTQLIETLALEGYGTEQEQRPKLQRQTNDLHGDEAQETLHTGDEDLSNSNGTSRQTTRQAFTDEDAKRADRGAEPERGTAEQGAPVSPAESARSKEPRYRVFTTAFDETVGAETLCSPHQLLRLRAQLDRQLRRSQQLIARLAHRLQRRLLAQQMRDWTFDLEEGWLDTSRLDRVVLSPLEGLSFKMEKESPFRGTVVSLLIDNSSSMRGRPMATAAMTADILSQTLERCGVKVEVLGFTTRSWKGGRARDAWRKQGEPAHPGRLNELRHIIYKSADAPWRRTRKNLGVMLADGVPKENIDGEALLWAHRRLITRPEERRILVVVSDGEPADEATLAANSADYLEKHLHEVIAWIEARLPVELLAIGIGHDVTRYYRHAITLRSADELGGALIEEIAKLFEAQT